MSSGGSGMELSESFVKSRARTFDLESVFTLRINLRSLHTCLNQCADLVDLDLSYNSLTSLSPLDGSKLTKLRRLNLAGNKFTSLDSIPAFPSLHTLRLEGNQLASPSVLAVLAERCPSLRALWLTRGGGSSGLQSNPFCSGQGWRLDVLAHFPELESLDGQRVGRGAGSGAQFYTEYAALDKATAQWADANSVATNAKRASQEVIPAASQDQLMRKMEDWLPHATWPSIQSSDIESDLAPRVVAVKASLKDCARVLSEECDQMLEEMDRKYKDTGNNGEKRDSTRASPTGEGNFGTFGDTDE